MQTNLQNQNELAEDADIFNAAITLAEISSIDSSLWKLCLHPFEYKRDLNPDLEQLIEAHGTNPFFNTAFIAASRDRMIRQPVFQMIVWEFSGETPTARFSAPLYCAQKTVFMPEHYQTLTHPFAPFGDPLIDQTVLDETLERLSDLLKLAFEDGMEPIIFSHQSENSKLQFLSGKADNAFATKTIPQGKRSAIKQVTGSRDTAIISKKRQRELNRLCKKLEQEGDVTFERVSDPIDVMIRFEEFLLMETKGWKGRIGSSIHVIKKHAAFARQSVNDLAKEGLCEIFTMRFNGSPIASIILFQSGGYYFPWKTTYDHLFSKYSPGSQLMNRLTKEIMSRENFKGADSLANFGRSWMTHLWPDETSISSIIFAQNDADASHLAERIMRKDSLKSSIKKFLLRR